MLKNKNLIPPGGYSFTEERTGLKFNKLSFNELIDEIIRHREYKGLDPIDKPTVELEIELYICDNIPKRYLRD